MRYQYTSPGFRQRFSPPTFTIPKGVKFLVIINIIVFILAIFLFGIQIPKTIKELKK
mgnify:CR=1 FL=1